MPVKKYPFDVEFTFRDGTVHSERVDGESVQDALRIAARQARKRGFDASVHTPHVISSPESEGR